MKKAKINFLIAIAISMSIVSCSDAFDTSYFDKEREDPELDISVKSLPIGYVKYSVNELFEELNDNLTSKTGDDNLIVFSYSDTISSSGNENFIKLEDQTHDNKYKLLEDSKVPNINYTYGTNSITDALIGTSFDSSYIKVESLTEDFDLDYEITTVYCSSGTLKIDLQTTNASKSVVNFNIPSVIKKSNGNAYEQNFTLNDGSATSTNNISINVNLADYKLDLTNFNPENNSEFNNLAAELNTTTYFANGDVISSKDELTYSLTLESLVVQFIEGDFKQESFNVNNQTFNLDFLDEIKQGDINFESPSFTITANNKYGFPIGITLEGISTNGTTNNTLTITDDNDTSDNIVPNTDSNSGNYAIINTATHSNQTITSVNSSISLNTENSNIADLLNEKPSQFIINVNGKANPNSSDNNTNFFDADNSNLELIVDVELPLHVSLDQLSFKIDPVEFDFDEDEIKDFQSYSDELSIIISSKSTIPFNGNIDMDFVDENNNPLFSKNINIEAAPVNSNSFSTYSLDDNGILTNTSGDVIDGNNTNITLTKSNIDDLSNVKEINLSINFDTDGSDVKIRTTDAIKINLGLGGNLTIDTNEL